MASLDKATIIKLSDSGLRVVPTAEDIRGRKVKDKDGKVIGKVHDLLIDDQVHEVRFLLVEHGGLLGLGETKSFIPVDAITKITADDVFIDHAEDHVARAPRHSPDLVNDRTHHASIYSHYDYPPFWQGDIIHQGIYTWPVMR